MRAQDFDLVVIGGGTAGIAAAKMVAGSKLKVALVDRRKLDLTGIECFAGTAKFVSAREIVIDGGQTGDGGQVVDSERIINDGRRITAAKFLIATGSRLKNPAIAGLGEVKYLTPDDIFMVERVPQTVLIIGGGASGIESAQYLAKLGSAVAIAEMSDRLLPREDEEAGAAVEKLLTERFNATIFKQARVVAVEPDGSGIKAIFLRDGQEKMVRVGAVVVATGREPAIAELELEKAGVKLTRAGRIKVDKTLQTTAKNIFAAGSVLGGESSIERAVYEGGMAVKNILKRASGYTNYQGFARVIETDPPIAVVGLTEDDLIRRAERYQKISVSLSEVLASRTSDSEIGFMKLLAEKDGKVLGATIMAPNATEIVAEVAIAIRHGLSVRELASTPHIATSWSDLIRLAARKLAAK